MLHLPLLALQLPSFPTARLEATRPSPLPLQAIMMASAPRKRYSRWQNVGVQVLSLQQGPLLLMLLFAHSVRLKPALQQVLGLNIVPMSD